MLRDWAQSFVIALALFIVIRAFFDRGLSGFRRAAWSSTLLVGDFLLVNKLAYGAEVPFTGHRSARARAPAARRHHRVPLAARSPHALSSSGWSACPATRWPCSDGHAVRSMACRRRSRTSCTLLRASDPADVRIPLAAPYRRASARGGQHEAYHPSRNNWGPLVVPQRATSCSATTATTRPTAAIGASCRRR